MRASEAKIQRTRIRAFRAEDGKAQVERGTAALRVLYPAPLDLLRALRQARRARLQGCIHYDVARHAALMRLARGAGTVSADGEPGT